MRVTLRMQYQDFWRRNGSYRRYEGVEPNQICYCMLGFLLRVESIFPTSNSICDLCAAATMFSQFRIYLMHVNWRVMILLSGNFSRHWFTMGQSLLTILIKPLKEREKPFETNIPSSMVEVWINGLGQDAYGL